MTFFKEQICDAIRQHSKEWGLPDEVDGKCGGYWLADGTGDPCDVLGECEECPHYFDNLDEQ